MNKIAPYTCAHMKMQREWHTAMCDCAQCVTENYRLLTCQDCGYTLMREGAEGFEEQWARWPDWYDVE